MYYVLKTEINLLNSCLISKVETTDCEIDANDVEITQLIVNERSSADNIILHLPEILLIALGFTKNELMVHRQFVTEK